MDDSQRALDRALRSLAVRAHSEQELVKKLEQAGFDERIIAETMAKLASYHFTDDETFAAQWAAARARRGLGPWRIARELRDKGIARETADEIIAGFDEDAGLEAATALALKHLRKGDERARRRAYDAMIRRGYGYDMARQALDLAIETLQNEAEE